MTDDTEDFAYPFSTDELGIIRRAYARQMLSVAMVGKDPLLESALASVPREAFLGAPPWYLARGNGRYVALPSNDPTILYQDLLFRLSNKTGINNGSPSLHAHWLHAAQIAPGETVVHIGAGSGWLISRVDSGFSACSLGPARFVWGQSFSQLDDDEEKRLQNAIKNGGAHLVRSFDWNKTTDQAKAWFAAKSWALSYEVIS